jgi:8-oxo-dGTP diphosphatase
MDKKIVIGVVVNGEKVLIVRRKQKEGDLFWQFPGGAVEDGETDEQAVIRELREETGVRCKIIKCIGSRIHPSTHREMSYWVCEFVEGDILVSDEDLDAAVWVEICEAITYFTTPVFPPILEYLGIKDKNEV